MKKKIGVLGTGMVGQVLASGFLKHGHEVRIATRNPEKVADWLEKNPRGAAGTHKDVSQWADIIVLATKGTAAEEAMRLCDSAALAGKTIIDATNPIADAPPTNGVLHYFTTLEESLMERLQKATPAAHFVKAFNSVGNAFMVNPKLPGGPPTMFICGNDDAAKQQVAHICDQFGWDAEDMGKVEVARAIEPLCQLWCARGFNRNEWSHAFKMVKV